MVPLTLPDLDCFQILRASIARFWACEGTINVVVRDQDEAAIAAVVGDDTRYHVLRESTIAPILAECDTGHGWYRQQLIKLAIAAFTTTDFYLTLDADCFLVRKIVSDDLVVDGRGAVEYVPTRNFPEWYDCIWNLEDARHWDASRSFQAPDFMFSVVQSNTGLPAGWTWERVKPYLGGVAGG